jgi:alpha-D-ribose 1-methylphosphonate 5-phosphate C-P lyase
MVEHRFTQNPMIRNEFQNTALNHFPHLCFVATARSGKEYLAPPYFVPAITYAVEKRGL